MEIGIALPTMATGFTRRHVNEWCRGIDEGPYSRVSRAGADSRSTTRSCW